MNINRLVFENASGISPIEIRKFFLTGIKHFFFLPQEAFSYKMNFFSLLQEKRYCAKKK